MATMSTKKTSMRAGEATRLVYHADAYGDRDGCASSCSGTLRKWQRSVIQAMALHPFGAADAATLASWIADTTLGDDSRRRYAASTTRDPALVQLLAGTDLADSVFGVAFAVSVSASEPRAVTVEPTPPLICVLEAQRTASTLRLVNGPDALLPLKLELLRGTFAPDEAAAARVQLECTAVRAGAEFRGILNAVVERGHLVVDAHGTLLQLPWASRVKQVLHRTPQRRLANVIESLNFFSGTTDPLGRRLRAGAPSEDDTPCWGHTAAHVSQRWEATFVACVDCSVPGLLDALLKAVRERPKDADGGLGHQRMTDVDFYSLRMPAWHPGRVVVESITVSYARDLGCVLQQHTLPPQYAAVRAISDLSVAAAIDAARRGGALHADDDAAARMFWTRMHWSSDAFFWPRLRDDAQAVTPDRYSQRELVMALLKYHTVPRMLVRQREQGSVTVPETTAQARRCELGKKSSRQSLRTGPRQLATSRLYAVAAHAVKKSSAAKPPPSRAIQPTPPPPPAAPAPTEDDSTCNNAVLAGIVSTAFGHVDVDKLDARDIAALHAAVVDAINIETAPAVGSPTAKPDASIHAARDVEPAVADMHDASSCPGAAVQPTPTAAVSAAPKLKAKLKTAAPAAAAPSPAPKPAAGPAPTAKRLPKSTAQVPEAAAAAVVAVEPAAPPVLPKDQPIRKTGALALLAEARRLRAAAAESGAAWSGMRLSLAGTVLSAAGLAGPKHKAMRGHAVAYAAEHGMLMVVRGAGAADVLVEPTDVDAVTQRLIAGYAAPAAAGLPATGGDATFHKPSDGCASATDSDPSRVVGAWDPVAETDAAAVAASGVELWGVPDLAAPAACWGTVDVSSSDSDSGAEDGPDSCADGDGIQAPSVFADAAAAASIAADVVVHVGTDTSSDGAEEMAFGLPARLLTSRKARPYHRRHVPAPFAEPGVRPWVFAAEPQPSNTAPAPAAVAEPALDRAGLHSVMTDFVAGLLQHPTTPIGSPTAPVGVMPPPPHRGLGSASPARPVPGHGRARPLPHTYTPAADEDDPAYHLEPINPW